MLLCGQEIPGKGVGKLGSVPPFRPSKIEGERWWKPTHRVEEDGRTPQCALVRDSLHVRERGIQQCGSAPHEPGTHAENDCCGIK